MKLLQFILSLILTLTAANGVAQVNPYNYGDKRADVTANTITAINAIKVSSTGASFQVSGTNHNAQTFGDGSNGRAIMMSPGSASLDFNNAAAGNTFHFGRVQTGTYWVFNPGGTSATVGINTAVGKDPSASLHVSGTSILGICNSNVKCGTNQKGAVCFSTVKNSLASCNGSNSWIPLTSTTLVSASGL